MSDLVSVPFFRHHQTIHCRSLVFWGEMGVAHDHLERPVSEQFCHLPQIYPDHYESTGKGMSVAMPRIALDLRLFESGRKPAPRSLQRASAPDGGKDRHSIGRLASASHLFERCQGNCIQRDRARMPVLGFRKINLTTLEAHLIPVKAVLLPHSHPGMDGE